MKITWEELYTPRTIRDAETGREYVLLADRQLADEGEPYCWAIVFVDPSKASWNSAAANIARRGFQILSMVIDHPDFERAMAIARQRRAAAVAKKLLPPEEVPF